VSTFVPGRALSRAFYQEILSPAIGVPHAAGLLGTGSDVLGYDTARSVDHDWGPRAVIFVPEKNVPEVTRRVAAALPTHFRGWPVNIGRDGVPFRPQIDVGVLSTWTSERLGVDPLAAELTPADWLAMPQQRILEVVSGAVFHDDIGRLTELRSLLGWYPDDVWWWMLACQWGRLAEEESFVQRTAEVGDDTGSAVVTARLVRDAMRLALLVARRYAPYQKWFGTAFSRLDDPEGLGRQLASALSGTSLREREDALGAAYQILAGRFNALADDLDVDATLRPFHDRPARILGASRFAEAALAHVTDPNLQGIPLVGSIDQVVDNVEVLTASDLVRKFRGLWGDGPAGSAGC
jgi:uncharacterized protein DUF4037